MEAIKSTVGELSQKEQDELMLFILQNRSGSKKGEGQEGAQRDEARDV